MSDTPVRYRGRDGQRRRRRVGQSATSARWRSTALQGESWFILLLRRMESNKLRRCRQHITRLFLLLVATAGVDRRVAGAIIPIAWARRSLKTSPRLRPRPRALVHLRRKCKQLLRALRARSWGRVRLARSRRRWQCTLTRIRTIIFAAVTTCSHRVLLSTLTTTAIGTTTIFVLIR